MTDLPRRSYPLVVAPPGGFEEAVRRGRRIRIRRAGGGTSIAVFVAGALTWSLIGHGANTSGLQPAQQPPVRHGVPVADASARANPSAAPTGGQPAVGPAGSTSVSNTGHAPATVAPVPGTPRKPAVEGPVYAKRNPITMGDKFTVSDTRCIGDASDWCAYADVAPDTPSAGMFELKYTLCRTVNAGSSDPNLYFHRTQQADFAVINTDENDQVWTWSAGQPVVSDSAALGYASGDCYTWTVTWDGYDDFGFTPHKGNYKLVATSLATGNFPTAESLFSHY